ncbi:uncharacterized protein LOC125585965 [Brassica napus]|uniref:uncharacterized protein LOC125585965 n=1 Tax=Brassica napus TaxID=3708 RepID=UPI002079E728|nr:uncharacterized protein LOC125585965 [Brassica napus]
MNRSSSSGVGSNATGGGMTSEWYDVEKPYGCQKTALLEARDLIREQAEELKNLRTMVRHEGHTVNPEVRAINSEVLLQMETMEAENKKLKQELASSCEREKMGRQFVLISWLGFVCVTAVIVNALK